MTPVLRGVLVAGIGVAVTFAAGSGTYGAYLEPSMWLPLWATGLALTLVGILTLAEAAARPSDTSDAPTGAVGPPAAGEPDDPSEAAGHSGLVDGTEAVRPAVAVPDVHDHAHRTPRVAFLLLLPLLVGLVVRPPALGADAARRDTATADPVAAPARFAPLPPMRDGAVDLLLGDLAARAAHDESRSLAGVPLRLTGFVVRDPELPDGYALTRFVMSCCAGDAMPVSVAVVGLDGPPPPDDTWVEVTAEWLPPDVADGGASPAAPTVARGLTRPSVTLRTQREVEAPRFPYE